MINTLLEVIQSYSKLFKLFKDHVERNKRKLKNRRIRIRETKNQRTRRSNQKIEKVRNLSSIPKFSIKIEGTMGHEQRTQKNDNSAGEVELRDLD